MLYFSAVLRSLFAIAAILFLTVICGAPAILFSLVDRTGDWVLRFGRLWARGICAASGVRVESHGVEHIPSKGPVILISNHQSNYDMLALLLSIPRPFRVVAKRLLFRIPIFGWCLSLAGMIPIDRDKRARAIQSLDRAAERVRSGEPVLLFPEGTRSPDGRLLPFKKGAFVIAVKAGVPIVPVSVAGGAHILPKGSIRVRPGRIVVRYGEPISVSGYTLDTKEQLMLVVRDAVGRGLEESAPFVAPPSSSAPTPAPST